MKSISENRLLIITVLSSIMFNDICVQVLFLVIWADTQPKDLLFMMDRNQICLLFSLSVYIIVWYFWETLYAVLFSHSLFFWVQKIMWENGENVLLYIQWKMLQNIGDIRLYCYYLDWKKVSIFSLYIIHTMHETQCFSIHILSLSDVLAPQGHMLWSHLQK